MPSSRPGPSLVLKSIRGILLNGQNHRGFVKYNKNCKRYEGSKEGVIICNVRRLRRKGTSVLDFEINLPEREEREERFRQRQRPSRDRDAF